MDPNQAFASGGLNLSTYNGGLSNPIPQFTPAPQTVNLNQPGLSTYGGNTAVLGASATADPYAQYGGQNAFNSLVNNFNTQQQNVRDTSGLAGTNAALGEGTSISQYIDSLKQTQKGLDNQTVQNYLAKQSGNQGILDWVGQGIRSGGVMLANKNASNSSAGDAVARAYSQLGRQQQAGVNQQFAQGQNQINQGEQAMQADIAAHIRDLPTWKNQTVNSIVSAAQQQLGQLDQSMAYMSLPDRVDMEAQKQSITNDVLSKLQNLDSALAKSQAVQPASTQDLQGQANQLFQAGTAPQNAFNYTPNAPAQFQNTGNFASELPLFTFPNTKKTG